MSRNPAERRASPETKDTIDVATMASIISTIDSVNITSDVNRNTKAILLRGILILTPTP
jgi:hypothetical protein